jgi:hypothetical protein
MLQKSPAETVAGLSGRESSINRSVPLWKKKDSVETCFFVDDICRHPQTEIRCRRCQYPVEDDDVGESRVEHATGNVNPVSPILRDAQSREDK